MEVCECHTCAQTILDLNLSKCAASLQAKFLSLAVFGSLLGNDAYVISIVVLGLATRCWQSVQAA